MAVYERGDTFSHWRKFKDRSSTATDPTSVKITITDPCNFAVVNNQNMNKVVVGEYYYNYNIGSSATYGKYNVKVSAVVSPDTSIFTDTFYILPWDVPAQVRAISGIEEEKTISDDDIARICWDAYIETLEEILDAHELIQPNYTRDIGTQSGCIDGTNTTFWLRHQYLADYNGDGVINGYGEASCGTDVSGIWVDENTNWNTCKITVDDSIAGKVTITQTSGVAIPATAKGIYLTYHTKPITFNQTLFRKAVAYLAAHEIILRFRETDRTTIADLNSNRPIVLAHPDRMLKQFKSLVRKLKTPRIGGVV